MRHHTFSLARALRRPLTALIAAIVAALLSSSVSIAPTHAVRSAESTTEMTTAQAGQIYLDAACAFTSAVMRYNQRVNGADGVITRSEVAPRLRELQREARRHGKAALRFARALQSAPAPWPEQVATAVGEIRGAMLGTHATMRNASTGTAATWWRNVRHAKRLNKRTAPLSMDIRLALELPLGCP